MSNPAHVLPPLPLENGALFIDNSGWVESLMTCTRSVEYKQLHKRIVSDERPALNFGSAIHLALEYRYVRYQNRPVDDEYYSVVSDLLIDFFAAHPCPLDDYRNLNWAITMIQRYNQRYAMEEFQLLKYANPISCPHCAGKGEVVRRKHDSIDLALQPCLWCAGTKVRDVMVELPFSLHLTDLSYNNVVIPVIFTGRIDLPVLVDGKLYVTDHKTTSMLGKTFFEEKAMSAQFRGYAWAFEQATGQNVAGFIVNAIRTKEAPQYVLAGKDFKSGTKTSSPDQWWNETFARERFILYPGDLDEWKTDINAMLSEFLFHYANQYMPRKTTWCVSKYGRCPYFDVCSTHPADQRLAVLHSGFYTNNTWSPLNGKTQAL